MKIPIIIYVAFGIVFSMLLGIEYNCMGEASNISYYASPFVFKQKSLASSMEYYFSISGLVLNSLIWSVVLYLIHTFLKKKYLSKKFNLYYKIVIALLISFTTLSIYINSIMLGTGFSKHSNYWYWNIDKWTDVRKSACSAKFMILGKK